MEIRVERRSKTAAAVRFCVSDTGLGVAPEAGRQSVRSFLAGRQFLCPQATGRGVGPGGGQAAGRNRRAATSVIPASWAKGRSSFSPCLFPAPRRRRCCANRKATRRAAIRPFLAAFPAHERADRGTWSVCWSRSATASPAPTPWPKQWTRAGKDHFDAIIASAADADMLAAAPGVQAPLMAVLHAGRRARQPPPIWCCAGRWQPDQLYRALQRSGRRARRKRGEPDDAELPAAIDAATFSAPGKIAGHQGADGNSAMLCRHRRAIDQWAVGAPAPASNGTKPDALAQDIVGAAGGLGLTAVTAGARGISPRRRARARTAMTCATPRRW